MGRTFLGSSKGFRLSAFNCDHKKTQASCLMNVPKFLQSGLVLYAFSFQSLFPAYAPRVLFFFHSRWRAQLPDVTLAVDFGHLISHWVLQFSLNCNLFLTSCFFLDPFVFYRRGWWSGWLAGLWSRPLSVLCDTNEDVWEAGQGRSLCTQ